MERSTKTEMISGDLGTLRPPTGSGNTEFRKAVTSFSQMTHSFIVPNSLGEIAAAADCYVPRRPELS